MKTVILYSENHITFIVIKIIYYVYQVDFKNTLTIFIENLIKIYS